MSGETWRGKAFLPCCWHSFPVLQERRFDSLALLSSFLARLEECGVVLMCCGGQKTQHSRDSSCCHGRYKSRHVRSPRPFFRPGSVSHPRRTQIYKHKESFAACKNIVLVVRKLEGELESGKQAALAAINRLKTNASEFREEAASMRRAQLADHQAKMDALNAEVTRGCRTLGRCSVACAPWSPCCACSCFSFFVFRFSKTPTSLCALAA